MNAKNQLSQIANCNYLMHVELRKLSINVFLLLCLKAQPGIVFW
jgi:hypothetical protein